MLGKIQETAGSTGTLHLLSGTCMALHGIPAPGVDPVKAREAGEQGPGVALAEPLGQGSPGWGEQGRGLGGMGGFQGSVAASEQQGARGREAKHDWGCPEQQRSTQVPGG